VRRLASETTTFAMVYVAQAHTDDAWPLGLPFCVRTTRTLSDRLVAIAGMVDRVRRGEGLAPEGGDLPASEGLDMRDPAACGQLYVEDPSAPTFTDLLAPWPLRFYVIDRVAGSQGRLVYLAQPRDECIWLSDLLAFLEPTQ
jgi:hypothetical protein